MNLKPIYPPLFPGQRVQCAGGLHMVPVLDRGAVTVQADLDAEPGTYYCGTCAPTPPPPEVPRDKREPAR